MSGSDFLKGQFQKKSFQKIEKNKKNTLIEKIFADSEWAGLILQNSIENRKKKKNCFRLKSNRYTNFTIRRRLLILP